MSPDGGSGAEPLLHPVSTRPTSAASGAAQPPRPQGAGFRRKREPRGAGGRRKPVQTLCVKTGVRGTCPPTGGRGRSPCFTRSPPDRRARRAGRRSRRARRARASAGSASRAEPGEGENRYRRYALKRGSGAEPLQMGRVPPPIRPQGRRPFNAPLRLSAPYYTAAYPRTRIARRISHKIVGRGVDYDSPADYLRNGEALSVYRAESKSVV